MLVSLLGYYYCFRSNIIVDEISDSSMEIILLFKYSVDLGKKTKNRLDFVYKFIHPFVYILFSSLPLFSFSIASLHLSKQTHTYNKTNIPPPFTQYRQSNQCWTLRPIFTHSDKKHHQELITINAIIVHSVAVYVCSHHYR